MSTTTREAIVFVVRATTYGLVTKAIAKYKFAMNANMQYLHEAVLLFKQQVGHVLAR